MRRISVKLTRIMLLSWVFLIFISMPQVAAASHPDPSPDMRHASSAMHHTLRLFETEYGPEKAERLTELKQELVSRGHSETTVIELLSGARLNERVAELFQRNLLRSTDSGEVSYEDFARRIGLDQLKADSHPFAEEHKEELLAAEAEYGVDFRYIVAIKGIETRYGERTAQGDYNLLNSLVTQFVLSNRRSFSVRQLDAVLQLNDQYDAQIHRFNGSFAGAIGVAQWMPFSLLHYGVMESIDDITSTRKMIPSTANYLRENGWRPSLNGQPVTQGSPNWRSILRYNRSQTYVRVVTEIAEQLDRPADR